MTNQEIIEKFESDKAKASLGIAGGVFVQTDLVHEIVKALRSQPCEDAISRQAAIDGINRYFHDEYYQRTSIQDCRDYLIEDVIKDLPPVTPQPRTGHWKKMVSVYDMIEGKYRMIPYTHSDEELSNPPFYVCDCGNNSKKPTNYCPDCGVKMQVESEVTE